MKGLWLCNMYFLYLLDATCDQFDLNFLSDPLTPWKNFNDSALQKVFTKYVPRIIYIKRSLSHNYSK